MFNLNDNINNIDESPTSINSLRLRVLWSWTPEKISS